MPILLTKKNKNYTTSYKIGKSDKQEKEEMRNRTVKYYHKEKNERKASYNLLKTDLSEDV
jgi:hypothetical protein